MSDKNAEDSYFIPALDADERAMLLDFASTLRSRTVKNQVVEKALIQVATQLQLAALAGLDDAAKLLPNGEHSEYRQGEPRAETLLGGYSG